MKNPSHLIEAIEYLGIDLRQIVDALEDYTKHSADRPTDLILPQPKDFRILGMLVRFGAVAEPRIYRNETGE